MGEIAINPQHNVFKQYRKVNYINPYVFAPVATYNTYIGGVSGTISTASLLATKLGISVGAISNFTIDGSDIKCKITGSYEIPNGAFGRVLAGFNFPNVVTYYYDDDNLVTTLNQFSFCYQTNFNDFRLDGVTSCLSYCLSQTPVININLPNLTSCSNYAFLDAFKAKRYYIPRITSLGTTSGNDFVWQDSNYAGTVIYINPIMQTNNSGAPDGDLVATTNATVRYVTNFTAPNPVTTLAAGTIYNTVIQLNFTPPSSTNAIEYYEVYKNGVFVKNITSSGEYLTELTASTSYDITLIAVDIFYNKSVVSNSLSVSTNTTSYLEYRTIAAYSLATNGVDAKNAYNGTVGAGVSFSSGAVFTNVTNSNIIVADNNDFSFTNGTNDLPFSISFKINFSALGDQWIVNKRNATGATDEWQVIYYLGKISLFLFSNSGSAYIVSEYTFTPTTGVDYTFAFTYAGDGASGLKVYRDGVLRTTTNTTFGSYTKMPNGTAPVTIGAQGWNLSAGRLTAKLKELYFFNSELTPTDVTYLQTNNYPF